MKSLIVPLILALILFPLPVAAQDGEPPVIPPNLEPITANNIHRLELLARFGFGSIQNINWSPDGYTLAIEGTNGTWLYSMDDLNRPYLLQDAEIETWMQQEDERPTEDDLVPYRDLTNADNFDVALSKNNALLAAVEDENTQIWDTQSKQVLAIIPTDYDHYANRLTFSPDAEQLAVAFFEETDQGNATNIAIWDVNGAQEIAILREEHIGSIIHIAFDPTGTLLASVDINSTMNVWNLETGELIASLSDHSYGAPSLAFNPSGELLASVGGLSDIILWDVMSGRQVLVLRPETSIMAHWLQFIDPDTLFVTGICGPLHGWNVVTGEQIVELYCKASHKHGRTAFSPDGRWIVGISEYSNLIKVWDVETDTLIIELVGHDEDECVITTVFSPDGSLLASGSTDNTIRLWDTETWEEKAVITQHQGSVWALAFSPDSRFLVSASDDGTARLWYTGPRDWDTRTGTQMAILYTNQQQDNTFVFSPDGRLLVTSACRIILSNSRNRKCSLVFWDTASVQAVRVIQMEHTWVNVTFNPENTLLAIGTAWGGIELWGVP